MTTDELLQQAKAAYQRSTMIYRDTLLETGRLLHEFVLTGLREGDGLSEPKRLDARITRGNLLLRAAEELRITRIRVQEFIAAAMIVELLGDRINLEFLGFISIIQFRSFVRRVNGGGMDQKHPSSLAETWHIRNGYEVSAKELFRRAVTNGFTTAVARVECDRLAKVAPQFKRRISSLKKNSKQHLEQLARVAHIASPGDVADMCMSLVTKSDDPWAVAQRLIVCLKNIKRTKQLS